MLRLFQYTTHGVTRNKQFLVSRNHINCTARALLTDQTFASVFSIQFLIKLNPNPLKAVANSRAHFRGVLADAACENDSIRALHRREICRCISAHDNKRFR
jgi:hypothetical protein